MLINTKSKINNNVIAAAASSANVSLISTLSSCKRFAVLKPRRWAKRLNSEGLQSSYDTRMFGFSVYFLTRSLC